MSPERGRGQIEDSESVDQVLKLPAVVGELVIGVETSVSPSFGDEIRDLRARLRWR